MTSFENWLTSAHQDTEAILNAFGMLSLLCRREKLTESSLSQIEQAEEIARIRENLDDKLKEYGEECCADFQNALELYAQYLSRNEDKQEDETLNETLLDAIRRQEIPFVDKRAQGGALWIIGGRELSDFVKECRRRGVYFQFCPGGGKSTQGQDAWYVTGDAEFKMWQQMKMDT